jgi:sarcosine oxidase
MTHYDCIVVGVGAIGSATLYHLARRGARVLGIDPWEPGHDHGSSHGETRAIRMVYFEHPDYVPLLRRAFELWEELHDDSETPLFHKTGILQAGPPDGEVMQGLIEAARVHDLPMDKLSRNDVQQRFPGFDIAADHSAIFDPNGGLLRVEDCIRRYVELARRHGAELSVPATVRHWFSGRDCINVDTDDEKHTCDKLVITPGAWAPRLLPRFSPHLELRRKALFWFGHEDPCYQLDNRCPVYLFEQGPHTFYGFPALDDKGIKVSDHAGGRVIEDPSQLDNHVDTSELEAVSLMIRQFLPLAGHQLNDHKTCMYTMSSDGHFIVGQYPDIPRVNIVAGLSGHGFKFASVLGEIMADLTEKGSTPHPIEFLSPDRFGS